MKKLILIIFLGLSLNSAFAQFELVPKVAKNQASSSKFLIEAVAQFTNNGGDSLFEWNILEVNIPSGWTFGMCDPYNCLDNVVEGRKSGFTLGKGKGGEFKGDFTANSIPGNGFVKVHIYSRTNASIQDTLAYAVNAWPVGVRENSKSNFDFSFFPNPAKERLVIKYATREPIQINIYNILGVKVKTITHSGNETEINIGDLQNGIYFIRFKDGSQTISKSFTKSE
jgi:hypothetical protein